MGKMIETSPWPEQPQPPLKQEPLYHVECYGDRHFTAYEGKDLLAVTAYVKGAKEITRRMEAWRRAKANLRHENPRLRHDARL